jgi:hypothetical protein
MDETEKKVVRVYKWGNERNPHADAALRSSVRHCFEADFERLVYLVLDSMSQRPGSIASAVLGRGAWKADALPDC